MKYKNIVITGTGSYIPTEKVTNQDFLNNDFFDAEGNSFEASHEEIFEKFKAITGIEERRYVSDDLLSSDIGTIAAQRAIEDAGISKEDIDQIIVAQNFGDVKKGSIQSDFLPSIGSRIKHHLKIVNPQCIAYDIIFGCPGWVQGMIQAESYIKSGLAKRCLVVATETLSRVLDPHDRDSMIYSDGAGACIVEAVEGDEQEGILASSMGTHTLDEAYYLFLGKSSKKDADPNVGYLKMFGRKIYEFALTHVPNAMRESLNKANVDIQDVKKILIHQANEKLDYEVVKRFYRLYKIREIPKDIMPMTIHELGNSSVATVPTLFDEILKNKMEGHEINKGDVILFAAVGAGMNLNCITYKY